MKAMISLEVNFVAEITRSGDAEDFESEVKELIQDAYEQKQRELGEDVKYKIVSIKPSGWTEWSDLRVVPTPLV